MPLSWISGAVDQFDPKWYEMVKRLRTPGVE